MKDYLKLHASQAAYETWLGSTNFIKPNVSIINGLSNVLYETITTTTLPPEATPEPTTEPTEPVQETTTSAPENTEPVPETTAPTPIP